jgi:hypothetical protein
MDPSQVREVKSEADKQRNLDSPQIIRVDGYYVE